MRELVSTRLLPFDLDDAGSQGVVVRFGRAGACGPPTRLKTFAMMTVQEKLEAGNVYCREHLVQCCQELLEWQRTSILPDGRVRALARIYDFAGTHALSMAESTVKTEAMRRLTGEH